MGRKLAILLMIAVLLSGCVKVDYLVDSEFMPLTAKSAKPTPSLTPIPSPSQTTDSSSAEDSKSKGEETSDNVEDDTTSENNGKSKISKNENPKGNNAFVVNEAFSDKYQAEILIAWGVFMSTIGIATLCKCICC